MIEDNQETIALNLNVNDTRNDRQIAIFPNLKNNIEKINPTDFASNEVLMIATCHELNGIGEIFLTYRAFQSLKNALYKSSVRDVLIMNELRRLLSENLNLFHFQEEIEDDDDYIAWSLVGDNLINKRKEFRQQIDLCKTYDNQNHSVIRLLIEIIDYYIKEYLVRKERFPASEIEKLEMYFQQAIQEKNYLKYFIKVYTTSSKFHRVLNKHLALYVLDYFDINSYSSGYRLINCLVYIVTLIINHPDIHKYQYNGTTFRGLRMTENALEHYRIGNHILNRSFVSTTKDRAIAEIFAGNDQPNGLEPFPNDCGLKKASVLLKYTIKQNQTAIDITQLSMIKDEEEILILPFSVFQVKNRTESRSDVCSSVLIEIELEECEGDAQTKNKEHQGKQCDGV